MMVSFRPAVTFTADYKPNNTNNSANPQPNSVVEGSPKRTPVKDAVSDVAKFFVSTSEMTKATVKGGIYGFLTGTAVAGYRFMTKAIPQALKKGDSILEVFKHPAKSIGWKGNLFAASAAILVAGYHIIKGKLSANQRTANVDHQLYTGHRDI